VTAGQRAKTRAWQRAKAPWGALALVAVAAVVIAAALAAHYRAVPPARQPATAAAPNGRDYMPASDPGGLSAQPLEGLGRRLAGPPAEAVAPPQARFQYAFEHSEGTVSAAYVATGDLLELAGFYTMELGRQGYKLVRRSSGVRGEGSELLSFARPSRQYTVTLLPADKNNRTFKIILLIGKGP
jgi:hypothetical protein